LKGFVQGYVDIFVDCRGDEKPAMVTVVGGEVGAATTQCDAQRLRTMIIAKLPGRRVR